MMNEIMAGTFFFDSLVLSPSNGNRKLGSNFMNHNNENTWQMMNE